jgi:hypothetical protein
MKQDNVLILIGGVVILLAILLAFDDNLSEASPVLLVLGLGCFAWLIYRRTWQIQRDNVSVQNTGAPFVLSKLSSLLGIGGLMGFGLRVWRL